MASAIDVVDLVTSSGTALIEDGLQVIMTLIVKTQDAEVPLAIVITDVKDAALLIHDHLAEEANHPQETAGTAIEAVQEAQAHIVGTHTVEVLLEEDNDHIHVHHVTE